MLVHMLILVVNKAPSKHVCLCFLFLMPTIIYEPSWKDMTFMASWLKNLGDPVSFESSLSPFSRQWNNFIEKMIIQEWGNKEQQLYLTFIITNLLFRSIYPLYNNYNHYKWKAKASTYTPWWTYLGRGSHIKFSASDKVRMMNSQTPRSY